VNDESTKARSRPRWLLPAIGLAAAIIALGTGVGIAAGGGGGGDGGSAAPAEVPAYAAPEGIVEEFGVAGPGHEGCEDPGQAPDRGSDPGGEPAPESIEPAPESNEAAPESNEAAPSLDL
jgi:hypothetical protein